MESRTACVIDKDGFYIAFVLVKNCPVYSESGQIEYIEKPVCYSLDEGNSLIYTNSPGEMVKPCWNKKNEIWTETATQAELDTAYDKKHPGALDEIKRNRIADMRLTRDRVITAGVEIETSMGVHRFTISDADKSTYLAMTNYTKKAAAGEPSIVRIEQGVPQHADDQMCDYWPVEDFSRIVEAVLGFTFYHNAYCSHLEEYIRRMETKREVNDVQYGASLPRDLEEHLGEILA